MVRTALILAERLDDSEVLARVMGAKSYALFASGTTGRPSCLPGVRWPSPRRLAHFSSRRLVDRFEPTSSDDDRERACPRFWRRQNWAGGRGTEALKS